ncbi:MAG: hypothetical protein VB095_12750 [Anaerovorax sp.]|nr:hypothetical protein [Anaerovorax sp.]
MIDQILKGMAEKLKIFGLPVYLREVKEEQKTSCFFILPLASSAEKMIGNRYRLNHSFEVQYYPPIEEVNVPAESVETSIFEILSYISAGEDLIHGTKMSSKSLNGVFHFYVDYNFYSYKEEEKESVMEYADVKNGLKEE